MREKSNMSVCVCEWVLMGLFMGLLLVIQASSTSKKMWFYRFEKIAFIYSKTVSLKTLIFVAACSIYLIKMS